MAVHSCIPHAYTYKLPICVQMELKAANSSVGVIKSTWFNISKLMFHKWKCVNQRLMHAKCWVVSARSVRLHLVCYSSGAYKLSPPRRLGCLLQRVGGENYIVINADVASGSIKIENCVGTMLHSNVTVLFNMTCMHE